MRHWLWGNSRWYRNTKSNDWPLVSLLLGATVLVSDNLFIQNLQPVECSRFLFRV